MTYHHRHLYLLCGVTAAIAFIVGFLCGQCIDLSDSTVHIDRNGALIFPETSQIRSIRVDLHCWVVPDFYGARYEARFDREDVSLEKQRAFDALVKCLRESAAVTTNQDTEATGVIELLIDDGRRLRIHTRRHHHLIAHDGRNSVTFIYDAETVEILVRHHGRLISDRPRGFNY